MLLLALEFKAEEFIALSALGHFSADVGEENLACASFSTAIQLFARSLEMWQDECGLDQKKDAVTEFWRYTVQKKGLIFLSSREDSLLLAVLHSIVARNHNADADKKRKSAKFKGGQGLQKRSRKRAFVNSEFPDLDLQQSRMCIKDFLRVCGLQGEDNATRGFSSLLEEKLASKTENIHRKSYSAAVENALSEAKIEGFKDLVEAAKRLFPKIKDGRVPENDLLLDGEGLKRASELQLRSFLSLAVEIFSKFKAEYYLVAIKR